jgi:hypothetical protein
MTGGIGALTGAYGRLHDEDLDDLCCQIVMTDVSVDADIIRPAVQLFGKPYDIHF